MVKKAVVRHLKPEWMRGLDQDQIDFYLALGAEATVCRGRRRHRFHDLIPGQPVPDEVAIEQVGGVYQLTDHCSRGCGRWVTYVTDQRGVIDYSTAKYGGGGPHYLATGLALTAADDREFMAWQQAEVVRDTFALRSKRRQATAG